MLGTTAGTVQLANPHHADKAALPAHAGSQQPMRTIIMMTTQRRTRTKKNRSMEGLCLCHLLKLERRSAISSLCAFVRSEK